jgi:hypothetical protein
MASSSSQNQGMLIAMIIFVILMVISMGLAVLFMKNGNELATRLKTTEERANKGDANLISLQTELDILKNIVMASPSKDQDNATAEEIKARYEADLKKFGARLNAVDSTIVMSTYTQMIDAATTSLEKKQAELLAEKATVQKTTADKNDLDAHYKGQVMQFETAAKTANDEKAAALKTLTTVEADLRKAQEDLVKGKEENVKLVEEARALKQKEIDVLVKDVADKQVIIDRLNEFVHKVNKADYAASFDGKITKINPSARTVWINVGSFDNLKKHISFSVQPQGVAAGSEIPPKAKIEVVQLLGPRLAECRIVEDDLNNPISVGDNIYTNLWDPGQKTRFGFAGKIDMNDDGTDDMDQVHSLVATAGGQIDVEVVDGVEKGELSIYTRYLVLGAIPADKPSAEAYNRLLDKAEKLGVQRIPLPVFLDQIGVPKSDRRRVVFGGGSQTGTVAMDPPDGGPRVSVGSVSPLFTPRRAPAAPKGTAY